MLKIKNIPAFREKHVRIEGNTKIEPDFIGYSYPRGHRSDDPNEKRGFFGSFNSSNENIEGVLTTTLEMAQDTQAIFEFVQNAVDADATDFFMYYDEEQFIALNNGHPFSEREVRSILNVGDSTKNSKDGIQYIGEFGVGFKLIHRMVGEQNGVKRLINDYKGPLLFSWNEENQLRELLEVSHPDQLKIGSENLNDSNPWFFKFLLTCVPCLPQEMETNLRNLDYELANQAQKPLFDNEELSNFNQFLNRFWSDRSEDLSSINLSQGSLFYLRLGENKKDLLDEDFKHYKKGLNYSLKFIETIGNRIGLKKIFFNEEDKISTEGTNLSVDHPIKIDRDAVEYTPLNELLKDKERGIPIVFRLAYEPFKKGEPFGQLKQSPNFYKYFPMGKEVYGLNFIVHSNAFRIEASRREFQQNKLLNRRLLSTFTNKLKERLDDYQNNHPETYRDIFLSILFSDIPANKEKDNEVGWIQETLYDPLFKYIKEYIPVSDGEYRSKSNVIIKSTALSVPNTVFKEEFSWFFYEQADEDYENICKRARDSRLFGLKTWNISKMIQEMPKDSFAEWHENLNYQEEDILLGELKEQLDDSLENSFWQNARKIDGFYELIKECENGRAQKNYLTSFDRIELKADEIDNENKELISIFALADRFRDNEEFLQAFQEQFYVISDSGEEYPLGEVAQKDTITFNIDNQRYELPLSKILPESYEKTSGVFAPVLDAFNNIDLEVNTLLGIKDERHKNKLAEHIESAFESYTSTQFVFFLLYSMEKETRKFKKKPDTIIALEALDYFFQKEYPYPADYEQCFDGLQAEKSVYPNSMAIEKEILPDSIIKWIEIDKESIKQKLEYLAKGGLKTEDHPYIELRQLICKDEASPDNSTDLSKLSKSDISNLFVYLNHKNPTLTNHTRDVFNEITKQAAIHGIPQANVPFPVFQRYENENASDLKLLSYNQDINSRPSYILDSSYFDKSFKERPCNQSEIVNTFISSEEAFLIDGRFLQDKYHISNSVIPTHHNDVEKGEESKLYIDGVNALFVYQFENETEYEIFFFEGGPPRCVKYKEFLFRRYEGNRFYIDNKNRTIFAGHISNTNEQNLYNTLDNYFSTFANSQADKGLHEQLKKFNPNDANKHQSKSDIFKNEAKDAELFTGEWLKHAVHWEKARKEEKYYGNRKHYFNNVDLNQEGRIVLSDYHKDIIPTFFEAYYDPVEISFYSDSHSKLASLDAPINRKNDFEVEVILQDDQKDKIDSLIQSEKVKAYVRLGEEDPWLKQLSKVLFGNKLIKDGDRLEDNVTHLWAEGDLSFIFGPPGTGKTTKSVLYALHDLAQAKKRECQARFLILTPTNKAADVFIEKAIELFRNPNLVFDLEVGFTEKEKQILYEFLDTELPSSFLYRYGTRSSEVIPFSLMGKSLPVSDQSLVATTVHRYVSEPRIKDFNDIDSDGVSKVILDEASMISLPHIMCILLSVVAFDNNKLKSSKLTAATISGDPFQLKPVGLTPNPLESQPGWSTESIYTLLKLHKFDLDKTIVGDYDIDNLKIQFRSSKSVGELYSDYCYEGLLMHHHDVLSSELDSEFKGSIFQILFQVHKLSADEYPITKIQRYGEYSSYHLYSSILAIELAAKIKSISDETVLLITPYGIQARILKDIVKADDQRFTDGKINAGTVHSSQGHEADHVILVHNPPKLKTGHSSFFNNQNIINVGISRAKKKLFVLMPTPAMMDTSAYGLHQKVLTDDHDIKSYNSLRFEEQVWNDSHYIKNQIGVANYSDFIVENTSKIGDDKRYKFYAGDGKIFSWFNPRVEKDMSDMMEESKNQ